MFKDDVEALAYFTAYFDFYNNVRRHGKIGYVTPVQRHCGEDKAILALRIVRLSEARRTRLQRNRSAEATVKVQVSEFQNEICLTGNPA